MAEADDAGLDEAIREDPTITCIGYGRYEGSCTHGAMNPAKNPLWCDRCEESRRKVISGQMAEITRKFEEEN